MEDVGRLGVAIIIPRLRPFVFTPRGVFSRYFTVPCKIVHILVVTISNCLVVFNFYRFPQLCASYAAETSPVEIHSMLWQCQQYSVTDLFDFMSCTLAWNQSSSTSTGAGTFKRAGTTGNQKYQGVCICVSWSLLLLWSVMHCILFGRNTHPFNC